MSCHPRELKKLRRFPVPESALEAGRKRLLEFMAETPMVPMGRRPWLLRWRLAAVTVFVAVFATSGGAFVLASQGALPGEHLYAVKLATEDVQERLTVSPAHKFAVKAAHAARRLDETEQLMARNGLGSEERMQRVRTALHAYEAHLFNMNAIALKMSVHPPKAKAGRRAIQAAERMLDRHAALIASATATQPSMTEAVLQPVDAAIELQSDVMGVVPAWQQHAGEDDERDALEERHQNRSQRIQEQLRALQMELEREKPLENLPKL